MKVGTDGWANGWMDFHKKLAERGQRVNKIIKSIDSDE